MNKKEQTLVNITEAARICKVTRQTMYNWIKGGKIIPIYIMNLPYIQKDNLLSISKR